MGRPVRIFTRLAPGHSGLALGIKNMNDNETILAELRKIGAWADMQRKITKWSFIAIAVFIPAMVVFGIVMEKRLNKSLEDVSPHDKPEKPTWSDVDWNIRRANLDEAIRIGAELTQKMPQYPEGYHRLAAAYLAAGKVEKAREHYAHAFRLFPSEESEKLLLAIDRRIKEGPQPNGAANGSQPLRSETNSTSSSAGSRR
jgi:tetratricopeptide (TPR) repeat protein